MNIAKRRIKKWIKQNDPTIELDLSELDLDILPDIPQNCQNLQCAGNNLETLQELPHCIILDCSDNLLTKLPELPNCQHLDCAINRLEKLPELPKCLNLDCMANILTQLPALPECDILRCSGNMLTELPELPNCYSLNCSSNELVELPELESCDILKCAGNKYLHIDWFIATAYQLNETPNYKQKCITIQKHYRKFIRNKYLREFKKIRILCNDVSNICTQYII